MILTKAPLRISFAGGGSDLPSYYQYETGACLSAAITAYMRVMVTHKFDGTVRLSYSKTENTELAKELQHDIARETLAYCAVDRAVEVVSVSDVPGGTGLGSSSAYAVALLQALYAFRGDASSPDIVAHNACEIEIDHCHHPIGKQDQYASAFGGLRLYEFYPDGVKVGLSMPNSTLAGYLMLFYTGSTRDANRLLADQHVDRGIIREMAQAAREMAQHVHRADWRGFADLMRQAWELKRRTLGFMPVVEIMLERAYRNGAWAGKLCGAGESGFVLLFVPPECQERVRFALNVRPARELRFRIDDLGSRVAYKD